MTSRRGFITGALTLAAVASIGKAEALVPECAAMKYVETQTASGQWIHVPGGLRALKFGDRVRVHLGLTAQDPLEWDGWIDSIPITELDADGKLRGAAYIRLADEEPSVGPGHTTLPEPTEYKENAL